MNLFSKMFRSTAVETKSVDEAEKMSSLEVSWDARPSLADDPKSLCRMAGQNPWVGAAVRKLSWSCGRVVPRVYAEGKTGKLVTPHKAASKTIVKSFQERNKAMEVVELTQHPLLALIDHPAPGYSWADICGIAIGYEATIGNAYFEIVNSANGKPTGLIPLMSECVSIIVGPNGKPKTYTYQPPTGLVRTFTPEQIFHARLMFPGSLEVGHGLLENCLKDSSLLAAIADQEIAMSANGCTPSMAIIVKGFKGSKKDAEVMADEFKTKFGGRRTGRPLVSFGDVEAKPIGISPKDMSYTEGREYIRSAIAAAFGIPENLIWSGSASRQSSETAMRQFKAETVMPLLGQFLDQFNARISAQYGTNVWIWFDPKAVCETNVIEQANVLNTYVAAGIITKDEARAVLGMEPLPEEEDEPEKPDTDVEDVTQEDA